MKKVLSVALSAAMALSLASCGSTAPAASTTSAAESTPAESAPVSSGTSSTPAEATSPINTTDPITISLSWWGGDARQEAYSKAIAAFESKYPNITVETDYGAWTGWEEKQSTALASGTATDVMQVNWSWLFQYSAKGQSFVDLNQYSDIIDFSNWADSEIEACTVNGELQAVPTAMTARIFYWNLNAFKTAGLESYPTTYDELLAAGQAFEAVGDTYYPLAIGAYDRMILMTYYLQSCYGKAWITDNTLNYTLEEITDGLNFIQNLEDNHVIPTIEKMKAAGYDSIDKSEQWINGQYGGIFDWDSTYTMYDSALADNSGFTVGDEIKFGDKANGAFSKVSQGMAVTTSSEHPAEAAALINFILNDPEGAGIMGTQCGMVASKSGIAAAEAAGAVNPNTLEAHNRAIAFVDMPFSSTYEISKMIDSTEGVYFDAFEGFSYKDYTAEEAAQILLNGVNEALAAA